MQLFNGLRSWFSRKETGNDVSSELDFHLEKEIELNLARGMSPEEARRQALVAFGGYSRLARKSTRFAGHTYWKF